MTVFVEMSYTVRDEKDTDSDAFFEFVHPAEAEIFREIARQYGYSSLRAYLKNQLHGWPDPDTLMLAGAVSNGTWARLALSGNGTSFGRQKASTRYTFFLFKQHDRQWKLAAMATLERDREDLYGNALTFHETDLPPKLRFPKLL